MSLQLVPVLDAVKDVSGGNVKTPQKEYAEAGDYPIVDQGQSLVGGFTDDKSRICKAEPPVIIFGDHTRAVKFIDFPFCMGADGTKVLAPREGHDPKYLFHAISALNLEGAGYSRHFKFLKEKRIPLPPLADQKRVAKILDAADALRAKRRESLAQLDALLQSAFLEMFGDPVENPKGWGRQPLAQLADHFCDGPFGSNLKSSHYVDKGVRVLRLQNIGVGDLLEDDLAFIAEDHFQSLPRNHCKPGDVIIGTLGDPNLRACVIPQYLDRALNKADCLLFRPNPEVVLSSYVCWLLNCEALVDSAAGLVRGQTRGRISLGRLKTLFVPVPPIRAQQNFDSAVGTIQEHKQNLKAQVAELDRLFHAVQQRAFSGNL